MLKATSKNKITTGLSIAGGLGLTGVVTNYYLDNAIYNSITNYFVSLPISQYALEAKTKMVMVIAAPTTISALMTYWMHQSFKSLDILKKENNEYNNYYKAVKYSTFALMYTLNVAPICAIFIAPALALELALSFAAVNTILAVSVAFKAYFSKTKYNDGKANTSSPNTGVSNPRSLDTETSNSQDLDDTDIFIREAKARGNNIHAEFQRNLENWDAEFQESMRKFKKSNKEIKTKLKRCKALLEERKQSQEPTLYENNVTLQRIQEMSEKIQKHIEFFQNCNEATKRRIEEFKERHSNGTVDTESSTRSREASQLSL